MRTLTVEVNGKEETFEGKTRDSALDKFRTRIAAMSDEDLHGSIIAQGYKDLRTFVVRDPTDTDNIEGWDDGMNYGVVIDLNGGGETREFATREEANSFFVRCADENGDHWD